MLSKLCLKSNLKRAEKGVNVAVALGTTWAEEGGLKLDCGCLAAIVAVVGT